MYLTCSKEEREKSKVWDEDGPSNVAIVDGEQRDDLPAEPAHVSEGAGRRDRDRREEREMKRERDIQAEGSGGKSDGGYRCGWQSGLKQRSAVQQRSGGRSGADRREEGRREKDVASEGERGGGGWVEVGEQLRRALIGGVRGARRRRRPAARAVTRRPTTARHLRR